MTLSGKIWYHSMQTWIVPWPSYRSGPSQLILYPISQLVSYISYDIILSFRTPNMIRNSAWNHNSFHMMRGFNIMHQLWSISHKLETSPASFSWVIKADSLRRGWTYNNIIYDIMNANAMMLCMISYAELIWNWPQAWQRLIDRPDSGWWARRLA